jgi:hypothetical protein
MQPVSSGIMETELKPDGFYAACGIVAGLKDISSVWKNIKEIDLKPIRDSATHPVRITLVGEQGSGRHTLAEQMRSDPARPEVHTQTPLVVVPADPSAEAPVAHLIIVMVDASRSDFSAEQLLVKKWAEAGKNVLVFINEIDFVEDNSGAASDRVSQPGNDWLSQQCQFYSTIRRRYWNFSPSSI